jgi:hypothetical protein
MEETLEEIKKRKQQLDEKKQQLIEKEKLITAKIANTDRRERTRRLIQVAAIVENALPITSTFNAEALAKYYSSHPDAHAEVSQYIIEKSPMIQAQKERDNIATRRNIRGNGSIDATK